MATEKFNFDQYYKDNDYVDLWYKFISDLTFKTWILKFNLEEGILLHKIIRSNIGGYQISDEDQSNLNKFISKVSTFFENIKSNCPPDSKFFVRLGSRSPKDAWLYSDRALQRFKSLLHEKYLEEYKSLNLPDRESKVDWVFEMNTMKDMIKISECEIKSLQCSTVDDIFDLFLNSERVLVDLGREIKNANPNFTICIRLWDQRVTDHLEFRGFVYQNKLCALTQYDYRAYYKDVYDNKDRIEATIREYYEKEVKPRMCVPESPFPDGTYIIDFGIVFKGENEMEAVVIELNRFHNTTGSALFNWDRDIDILTGKKDFEFRVVDESIADQVDYNSIISSQCQDVKKEIKAQIVNENKSYEEKTKTWIEDVTID